MTQLIVIPCHFAIIQLYYIFLRSHPEKTKVVYIINTDLKGRLPQKLVNAVLPDLQLTFFKGLHRAVAEELQTS